jgi:hypothetical protein
LDETAYKYRVKWQYSLESRIVGTMFRDLGGGADSSIGLSYMVMKGYVA